MYRETDGSCGVEKLAMAYASNGREERNEISLICLELKSCYNHPPLVGKIAPDSPYVDRDPLAIPVVGLINSAMGLSDHMGTGRINYSANTNNATNAGWQVIMKTVHR